MFDITALGELLIDFTQYGTSSQGQRLFEQNPGGAPANVLACAARLGLKTAFIGKVGKDMHGEFLRSTLESCGINTEGLTETEEGFTTLAFVSIGENGERSFSFSRKPGADTLLRPNELHKEIIEKSKVFHIGSLSMTAEPARSATLEAIECARRAGCIISYDPNYRRPLWKDENEAREYMRLLSYKADMIKISDEEAELLTDYPDPERAAGVLMERGAKLACVTLGEKGAYILCRSGGVYIPAVRTDAVDTTGAGDAFWGAFLYSMLKDGKAPGETEIEEAEKYGRFAAAAAAVCVSRRGAIPAMPLLHEAEALIH